MNAKNRHEMRMVISYIWRDAMLVSILVYSVTIDTVLKLFVDKAKLVASRYARTNVMSRLIHSLIGKNEYLRRFV